LEDKICSELEMCGIDKDKYTGFAFGVGLERVALLKYEIFIVKNKHIYIIL
jgi:phenylalanyl-tRNA synthetase alpha subunit